MRAMTNKRGQEGTGRGAGNRTARAAKAAAAWLVAAGMAAAWVPAVAADARAQLQRFVSEVESASGRFTQRADGAQGQPGREQRGEFAFRRPGQFRWHTQQPYEQMVVSDGKVLRQYDPDLAQVTERSVDESIGASPAAILFGSGSLEEAFELTGLDERDGLAWLRARPRGGDAGFSHVDIGFANGMPRRLELLDAFGQTSRITFSDLKANPQIPAAQFRFTVPQGADLVKMN